MSWDGYIDNLVAQSKDASGTTHADKACIIGLDGGAKWTSDTHPMAIKISGPEASTIATCLKNKDFSSFQSSGVHVENIKYNYLREEDGKLVLAKKKDMGAITIQASTTAIVIAHTVEGGQQGTTNKAVNVIAEYLISVGM